MTMEQTLDRDPALRREPDIAADGYRLARLPEVLRATGLPRTTIYKLMAARDFPRSIKLGPRAVAWRLAEVHAWISQRAADNRCKYEAPSYGAH